MKLLRIMFTAWLYLCLATTLAEAGLLAVLWKRGQVTPNTAHNLLVVAYGVPVREMYEKMQVQAQPVKQEMASFAEIENARLLKSLDLDLREMSGDKGLLDLRDLDGLLEKERGRYAQLNTDFRDRWDAMQKDTTGSELLDLRRQIESVAPNLAKDQLLRILNDNKLEPNAALHHVVTIFKALPVDKRKKIIAEFDDSDAPHLHEILRQIRLGMPQTTLIRDTRDRMEQFRTQN